MTTFGEGGGPRGRARKIAHNNNREKERATTTAKGAKMEKN